MIAVSLLAPFFGAGVERMLRGTPRVVRLIVGPPLAALAAMVAVPAAVIVAGGIALGWPDPEPYGPMLQAAINGGWQLDVLVGVLTVLNGCIAGTFASLFVALPPLYGVRDLDVRGARRRWVLPMAAAVLGGVLCLVGFGHGFGRDALSAVTPVIRPGQDWLHGTLVAPGDSDVYEVRHPRQGIYLLELPAPAPGDRFSHTTAGFELPQLRVDRQRWLITTASAETISQLSVDPTYPLHQGVVEYSGPMVFQRIESHPSEPWARVTADLEPGERGRWTLDLARGPRELVLHPGDDACWTLLGPNTTYSPGWVWTLGYPRVMLQIEAGGQVIYQDLIGTEGYGMLGYSVTVAGSPGIDDVWRDLVESAGSPDRPEVILRLIPASRPGEYLSINVVGEAPPDGAPPVHPEGGVTVLAMRPDDPLTLRPEPGGAYTPVQLHGARYTTSLARLGDDGRETEVTDNLMLMSDVELHLRDTSSSPAVPVFVVLGS
jgi:hypothetical protein